MNEASPYPIGTPGQPWDNADRIAWRARQRIQRTYADEVLARIAPLQAILDVEQYGTLETPDGTYPLLMLRSRSWHAERPTALITGGVHGYETSGVQGAIRFAATEAVRLSADFNLAIFPCVSPWGYETINRWNPDAIDPNRSFVTESPSAECAAMMRKVATLGAIEVHLDLHETTDTDNSEFRPARAARDAIEQSVWSIPDGFYLVGRTDRPVPAFQTAIRDAVAAVTHIAPDEGGRIIGVAVEQPGVINYDAVKLGLCMGLTDAPFTTTTEVYPDSPKTDPEACIRAQVAAVVGGLGYVAGLG
ncbi:MAG: hypothetical protein ACI8RZ_001043 [Myxococcota bacterium]|jgi:hypothetical protein